jgi:hypothetical protein
MLARDFACSSSVQIDRSSAASIGVQKSRSSSISVLAVGIQTSLVLVVLAEVQITPLDGAVLQGLSRDDHTYRHA